MKFCESRELNFVSFTNADVAYVDPSAPFLAFHVFRDPRDILVSSYFSSLKTHSSANWPELEPHRDKLQAVPKEPGLMLEMDFIFDVFEALDSWNYDDPRILEVKMEDLMSDNYTGFLNIASHLGLVEENDQSTSSVAAQTRNQLRLLRNRLAERYPALRWLASYPQKIPVANLLGMIHRNRFAAKAGGREPGKEDQGSHYRKGVSGDWRNHFTDNVEREFKARYGDLLVRLGYEKNRDWSFKEIE